MTADDPRIQGPARLSKPALVGLAAVLLVLAVFSGLLAGIVVVSSLLWLVFGAAVVAAFAGAYRWRRKHRSGS